MCALYIKGRHRGFRKHLRVELEMLRINKNNFKGVINSKREREILERFLAKSEWSGTQLEIFYWNYMTMGLDTGGVERSNAVLSRILDIKKGKAEAETIADFMILKHHAVSDPLGETIADQVMMLMINSDKGWRKVIKGFTGKAFKYPRSDIGQKHNYPKRVNKSNTVSVNVEDTSLGELISKGPGGGILTERYVFIGPVYKMVKKSTTNRDWPTVKRRLEKCSFNPPVNMEAFSTGKRLVKGSSLLQCALMSRATRCPSHVSIYRSVVKHIGGAVDSIGWYCRGDWTAEDLELKLCMRLGTKMTPSTMESLYLDTVMIAFATKISVKIHLIDLNQRTSVDNNVVEIDFGANVT